MSVKIPEKEDIININRSVIEFSRDPNEDKENAGGVMNESSLDFALHPPYSYNDLYEAAFYIAKSIANDHVFTNGNKRTASQAVIHLFDINNFDFMFQDVISSLVVDDSNYNEYEDEIKKNFITKISLFFHPREKNS